MYILKTTSTLKKKKEFDIVEVERTKIENRTAFAMS